MRDSNVKTWYDWSSWQLALLGALPFLFPYIYQLLRFPQEASGFIAYDLGYYIANARDIFERGNGVLYPNPFDYRAEAPAIYFHLLPYFLGVLYNFLKIDPGFIFASAGVLFAIFASRTTLALVRSILRPGAPTGVLFLIAMWGGGLFGLWSLTSFLVLDHAYFDGVLRDNKWDEFGASWWFLNWGRNLIFSTEALYHLLAAAIWVSIINQSWWKAMVATLALACASPWSGIQVMMGLLGWFVVHPYLSKYDGAPRKYITAVVVTVVGFVWYYFLFLESFPEHRQISDRWSLNWAYAPIVPLLAYVPVFALALRGVWSSRKDLKPYQTLFLSLAAVSLLLENHDLFIDPRQPYHFTRGYLWISLLMLGIEELQRLLVKLHTLSGAFNRRVLLVLFLTLVGADNLVFLAVQSTNVVGISKIDPALRALLNEVDQRRFSGVVGCESSLVCYRVAVYTGLNPYLGHKHLTPDYYTREVEMQNWYRKEESVVLPKDIDMLLMDLEAWPMRLPKGKLPEGWTVLAHNAKWLLAGRDVRGE